MERTASLVGLEMGFEGRDDSGVGLAALDTDGREEVSNKEDSIEA